MIDQDADFLKEGVRILSQALRLVRFWQPFQLSGPD
jgi:hypothetical protein